MLHDTKPLLIKVEMINILVYLIKELICTKWNVRMNITLLQYLSDGKFIFFSKCYKPLF
jgi:hypothetical protein